MKARFESSDVSQVQREEIKEQGAVHFGVERNQLTLALWIHRIINEGDIGGLAGQSRTVVHNLAIDLAICVVDKRHEFLGEPAIIGKFNGVDL